jgi:hypothetical protein
MAGEGGQQVECRKTETGSANIESNLLTERLSAYQVYQAKYPDTPIVVLERLIKSLSEAITLDEITDVLFEYSKIAEKLNYEGTQVDLWTIGLNNLGNYPTIEPKKAPQGPNTKEASQWPKLSNEATAKRRTLGELLGTVH